MLSKRREKILALVKQRETVHLSDLKELFPDFSEMTLRRDLDFLAAAGLVNRIHGGAALPKNEIPLSNDYQARITVNEAAKEAIAKQAVLLLEENRSIYLDAGTTMMAFARQIPDLHLFAITNAPSIGLEVAGRENMEIIFLGGSLNKATISISGPFALRQLDGLNIDTAFIATAGFSPENGFTNPYAGECELKRKVIGLAKKVIILMDHSKVRRNLPYTFATMDDVDVIVTDRKLPEDITEKALEKDIQVIC